MFAKLAMISKQAFAFDSARRIELTNESCQLHECLLRLLVVSLLVQAVRGKSTSHEPLQSVFLCNPDLPTQGGGRAHVKCRA